MAEKGPKKFSRFMRHFPTTSSLFSYYEYHQHICDCSKMWDTIHNMQINSSFKKSIRCF